MVARKGNPLALIRLTPTLFWLTLMALMLGRSVPGYGQMSLDNDVFSLPAGREALYLLDTASELQLHEVMSLAEDRWLTPDSETPSFGFQSGQLWVKLEVVNHTNQSQNLGLEIDYPVLDRVDGYVTRNGYVLSEYNMGDTLDFSNRPLDYHNFVIPFPLPPQEAVTLYLRIQSEGAVQAPILLWNMDRFFEQQQFPLIVHGLYFGIMLVMMLYNLFIYTSVRHASYLYYTFTVLFCAVLSATLEGLGFQFIWPRIPELNAIMVPLSIAILDISARLFSISLLDLRTTAPRLYWLCLAFVAGFLLILVGTFFLPYHTIIPLALGLGAGSILLSAFTGVYLLSKGVRIARFYLLAWFTPFAGILMMTLSKFGILSSNLIIEHAIQIGSAIEVVLLSFAMADRINEQREARYRAEQTALRNEQRANAEAQRYLELKHRSELDELQSRQEIIRSQAESKAKSEFLATMSHEIRTPMNGVLGMTDLLRESHLDPNQRHYLDIISSSGKALLNIINDILDYSKIAAGKMEIEQVDFDLDQLCLECASMFSLTAERKHLELMSSLEPGTPTFIKSDPTRLRQIIINLLGNAFKFTNTGHVSLRVMEQSRTCDQNFTLRFEVRDTGIGIAAEKKHSLFTAFSQQENSTAREYGGTGLGLSISKRLAELMGGEIGLESRIGEGSCFWFTIQCGHADQQFSREHYTPLSALKAVKLLIVDDSSEFAHVVQEQAESWGLDTDVAFYGDQALQKLRAATAAGAPFQVVTMDMNMPGMDGVECARQIKQADDITPCTCILLTSARTMPPKPQLQEAGIDSAIQKPASARVLQQAILGLMSEEKGSAPSNVQPLNSPLQGKSVLVAEDNSVNQMVIMGMLKKLGLKCEIAGNGEQALTLFMQRPNRFDLVFMDCEMPVMDGYSTCRKMRNHERTLHLAPTPIIALTAHALHEHRARAKEAGMDDHIAKPVELLTIKEKLIEFLVVANTDTRSA